MLRAFGVRFHGSISASKTHARNVPTMLKEITLESSVFVVNGVLADLGQAEECKESTQDAERGSYPERILVTFDGVASCISYKDGVKVIANECTDLAKGCSNGVVATTNSGGRSLGCDETNVVARTDCSTVSILLVS